ncbi:hypothetical protein DHL47_09340 [Streptococcus panodentis]|uniref:Uncharacterized protein n=1 Tax=Streptococcus panodentis TaxID=1581472 RepID=A0ABS5AYA8_9STRE|nr:hypothetical protein [Streptococcus panodentis]
MSLILSNFQPLFKTERKEVCVSGFASFFEKNEAEWLRNERTEIIAPRWFGRPQHPKLNGILRTGFVKEASVRTSRWLQLHQQPKLNGILRTGFLKGYRKTERKTCSFLLCMDISCL